MAYITEFRVQGYRAISEAITLRDLGTYVALYGDNAVGKSSVLQAVTLLGSLCALHPRELLGSGAPWPTEGFYRKFVQDPSMFNHHGAPVAELGAKTNTGLEVSFRLALFNDEIEVTYVTAVSNGTNVLALVDAARTELKAAQVASDNLKSAATEAPFSEERVGLIRLATERASQATTRLEDAFQDLSNALAPLKVSMGSSPALPVPDATRRELHGAMTSSDVVLRDRVWKTLRRISALFPALGAGKIDILTQSPKHAADEPKHAVDLAWISEEPSLSLVDLDHLGGGVQSVVATLASLLLKKTAIVCLEEPEAFVGALALDGLRALFHEAAAQGICEQVWVATHAVTLVSSHDPIVVLERSGGAVRAAQDVAQRLVSRFAQPAEMPHADAVGRLGIDGSVRIPRAMIERAGLKTGEHVFFSDRGGSIHVLTSAEIEATLPEPKES